MQNLVSRNRSLVRVSVLISFETATLESVLRQATLQKIAHTLWPVLSLDQQIQILLTLLNSMAYYTEVGFNRVYHLVSC